jgi:pyruvate formate lyase activating enzyme
MKINKREFIKKSLLAVGGICGAGCLKLMANDMKLTEGNSGRLYTGDEGLWKWSKESVFYEVTPRGPKCLICPNECTLKLNEVSTCRNRINKNDKLYTIAYGNPCAVHIDPIEKKPLYHFLPSSKSFSIATAGCNLACLNCQNWTISQSSPTETKNYDLMPEDVVSNCIKSGCESISYTYSEPITFFEYTYDSAKIAASKGIRNVLVTAGYINEEPLRYFLKYIDAANVDLKSFSDSIYLKLNAGKLQPILNTLKIMKEEGVWLEITNLIVPGWNDDFGMIKEMCEWLRANDLHNYPLHFSRFQPMYKLTQLPATPVSTLEKAREVALTAGIKFVYIGNVPGTDASNTHCPKCKKLLVERIGFQITQNHIKNNKCEYCGETIPGVWN